MTAPRPCVVCGKTLDPDWLRLTWFRHCPGSVCGSVWKSSFAAALVGRIGRRVDRFYNGRILRAYADWANTLQAERRNAPATSPLPDPSASNGDPATDSERALAGNVGGAK